MARTTHVPKIFESLRFDCIGFYFVDLAPYFTRGGTISVADSLSLTDATAIGTPIYEVFFTDDDPDDIASLSVTMTTSSTYFAFNTISCR